MNSNEKAKRVGIVFILLLIIGGVALMYTGNDAIVQGMSKKEGILTAEQVKMSFDSVSGRLIREGVKEGDMVKKGDIIMELDPTDTDLAIEKLKAQIAQMEAQINSTSGTMGINFNRANTAETQSFRQIDQQQAAVFALDVGIDPYSKAQTDDLQRQRHQHERVGMTELKHRSTPSSQYRSVS